MSSTKRDLEAETPFGTFSPNPAQRSLMRVGRMIPAGRYARKMARPLRSLLRRLSRTPIDVTVLGEQRMRSRIIAVEPHPLALERLRCNVRLNQLTNIVIEPMALNDRSGTVTFRPNRRNIGNSTILFKEGAAGGELIEVPSESLLDLAARHGLTRIDAIKIDVEGAEDLILFPFFASAPETLWPHLLLIENSEDQWRRDCRDMLIERGYRWRRIPSRNLVFWRPAPSP